MQVAQLKVLGLAFRNNDYFYYLIVASVLLCVLASKRMEDSRIGRAWVAIREDEVAAKLAGIPVAQLKLLAFTLSAAFAGLAGAIFAYWEGFVTPESFVFWESILIVSIVVLGGMGSVSGVLLGALILSGSPQLMQAFLSSAWINYRYLFFGRSGARTLFGRKARCRPSAARRAGTLQ